ncbi:hypothetical protein D187_006810 [Cystobacter fuscus DSM 2262]|uniref:Uncharacterized protein n=1 Tax=Cystobacter fuscus (strain ATCC 25194 / DSM 2262 / NBRC 100088 / M29) TaxID=1242864 RepID=S9P1R7_CYSF2|nr:hypothetical protein [Cystobacter fuscus]EPX57056.1 hypothetical protein D187_006810 [Cystobacter fuscus DSM 2262]
MGWLENVIFKNQEIANERLELTDNNSLYFLSTGLTLRNCTVVLTLFAPTEARRYDANPEEFRAIVERFDCILY